MSTPESKTVLLLSMSIQCWPDLVKYGARQHLEEAYAGYILPEAQTEFGYNVSLHIDLERLPATPGEYARRWRWEFVCGSAIGFGVAICLALE